MRLVMNNLVLHLHPSKVAAPTLKFNYTFGLGGLLALLATIQVITGVLLMFAYTPSPDKAYQSMLALQGEVWFGQLIRNLHHWSADLMIVAAALHLARVFFTGGFKSPREFNWLLGISLLLLVVAGRLERRAWPYLLSGVLSLLAIIGFVTMVGPATVLWAGLLGFSDASALIVGLTLPPLLCRPEDVARTSAGMFTLSYGGAVAIAIASGAAWDLSRIPVLAFVPIAVCAVGLVAAALALRAKRELL
jgi:quinol-cytochrome oxidoreductase complex cytochrome b subunit